MQFRDTTVQPFSAFLRLFPSLSFSIAFSSLLSPSLHLLIMRFALADEQIERKRQCLTLPFSMTKYNLAGASNSTGRDQPSARLGPQIKTKPERGDLEFHHLRRSGTMQYSSPFLLCRLMRGQENSPLLFFCYSSSSEQHSLLHSFMCPLHQLRYLKGVGGWWGDGDASALYSHAHAGKVRMKIT